MTGGELLGFLLERGKLVEHEGRLATDRARICNTSEGG